MAERRRLLKVELTARGVEGLLQPDAWLAEMSRLPAFSRENRADLAGHYRDRARGARVQRGP